MTKILSMATLFILGVLFFAFYVPWVFNYSFYNFFEFAVVLFIVGIIFFCINKLSGYKCPKCNHRSKKVISWKTLSKETNTYIAHKTKSGRADKRYKNNSPKITTYYNHEVNIKCLNKNCDESSFVFIYEKSLVSQPPHCNNQNKIL